MKHFQYLLLDASWLIQTFRTRPHAYDIVENVFRDFVDLNHKKDTKWQILMLMPPKSIARVAQYDVILKKWQTYFLTEYQLQYDFTTNNLNKLNGRIDVSDCDKKLFEMCCVLNSVNRETQQTVLDEQELLFLEDIGSIIQEYLPDSDYRVCDSNTKQFEISAQWDWDDMVFSTVNKIKQVSDIKNWHCDVHLLTMRRAMFIGQMLFNDTNDSHFNFIVHRVNMMKNAGRIERVSHNLETLLAYLERELDFPFYHDNIAMYIQDNPFMKLDYYIKLLDVVHNGFMLDVNDKSKTLVPRFGIKKLGQLCLTHLTPNHLQAVYDVLSDNDKVKKMLCPNQLALLNEIVDVHRCRIDLN